MSDYFNSPGVTEKERYTAKLGMVGLTLERDPYLPANAGNFVTDMTVGPNWNMDAYLPTLFDALELTRSSSCILGSSWVHIITIRITM